MGFIFLKKKNKQRNYISILKKYFRIILDLKAKIFVVAHIPMTFQQQTVKAQISMKFQAKYKGF